MALIITEEQQLLKSSANQFLKEQAPVAALRKLRDEKDPVGYDPALWEEMANMGWTSLTIPEAYGGLGFGFTGLGQVLEEMGRTLTASPMVATVLLGANIIEKTGNVMQKEKLLPAIAEGKMTIALAFEESNNHNPLQQDCTATKNGEHYILNGKKCFVLDGHSADQLLVTAQTEEGMSFFLLDPKTNGINIERRIMMDSRNAANISFDQVSISADQLLGEEGQAETVLEKVLDMARIGLAAEMLGTMQEAFERTINYLKERNQFGVAIGSFQGLQHRAAHMFCEIELCKSIVLKGLQTIDEGQADLSTMASLVKAKVGEVMQLVTNEAIQMFGGIGMTDDEEIGFFLKRGRVAQQTFGDYNYHLDRYARLNDF